MYMIKSEFRRQITLLVCPEIFCRGGGGRKRKGDEKKSEKRYHRHIDLSCIGPQQLGT